MQRRNLEFVDQEWENFARYVTTRWLSLGKCCDKELKKIAALKSMFASQIGKSSALDRRMGG